MATMKIPYNGEWVYVNDPTAERMIYKQDGTPSVASTGQLWIDTSASGDDSGIGTATYINLSANAWTAAEDSEEYRQTISVNGISSNSKIDLMPDAVTLNYLINNGITLYLSNNDGIMYCSCIGGVPTEDLVIPVSIINISNDNDAPIASNPIGSTITWGSW
jgi:hypothetical protein